MRNLLNEELTLTWGAHHYEEMIEVSIKDKIARVVIAFGKISEDGNALSEYVGVFVIGNDVWANVSEFIYGKEFRHDIKVALRETALEHLSEWHKSGDDTKENTLKKKCPECEGVLHNNNCNCQGRGQ